MPKLMGKRKRGTEEKVLDVDASMQGTLTFKDPVNLRINGSFEGELKTRGSLTIGQSAVVNADIEGDEITVAGTVNGNIIAKQRLNIISPAKIIGNIQAPLLSITEGSILQGRCEMESASSGATTSSNSMGIKEVATYLEVKPSVVNEWASQGKIPGKKEHDSWKFEKSVIDEWVTKEKVKQ